MTFTVTHTPPVEEKIEVTTDTYRITIARMHGAEPWTPGIDDMNQDQRWDVAPNPATRVDVSDALAEAADPTIAKLSRDVDRLTPAKRFADRGVNPAVDAVFDDLNARISSSKLMIADEVLRLLADVDLIGGNVYRAAGGAVFSRFALCANCQCGAGAVVAGAALWMKYPDPNRPLLVQVEALPAE